ncbi:MAG: tetratricopeptide repeat protein [Methanothrix sp.]|nr:tetratricopeptide repeat protein [Methanothrix sp.]
MKLCLAAILLILISMANAIEMKEDISVFGDGGLSAQTNIGDGKDRLSARGEQSYSRTFSIGEDTSSLATTYLCKNISNKGSKFFNNSTNYYYVSGRSAADAQHSLSISSNQSIESSATIERNGGSFATNYVVKSGYGNLTESLSDKIGARTNYLAESRISGNLTLSSEVTEDVQEWPGYEVDQMQKLSLVKTLADPGVYELTLETGYEKTPQMVAAGLINDGNEQYNNGNYAQALANYDKAIGIDSKSADAAMAWRYKGNVLSKMKMYSEAVKAYDEAIKLNPELKEAWISKTIVLIGQNKSTEALVVLNEIIRIYPGLTDALYLRGKVFKELGRYDESLNDFNNVLEKNPKHKLAWYNKGVLLYERPNLTSYNNNSTLMLNDALVAFEEYKQIEVNKELIKDADDYIEKIKKLI